MRFLRGYKITRKLFEIEYLEGSMKYLTVKKFLPSDFPLNVIVSPQNGESKYIAKMIL